MGWAVGAAPVGGRRLSDDLERPLDKGQSLSHSCRFSS